MYSAHYQPSPENSFVNKMSACFNHQKNLKQLRKVLHSGVYVKKDLLNITLKKDENRKAFRSSQPLDRRLIKMSTEPNCSSIEGVFPQLMQNNHNVPASSRKHSFLLKVTAFSWKSQLGIDNKCVTWIQSTTECPQLS